MKIAINWRLPCATCRVWWSAFAFFGMYTRLYTTTQKVVCSRVTRACFEYDLYLHLSQKRRAHGRQDKTPRHKTNTDTRGNAQATRNTMVRYGELCQKCARCDNRESPLKACRVYGNLMYSSGFVEVPVEQTVLRMHSNHTKDLIHHLHVNG